MASLAVYGWLYRHLLWLASSTYLPIREVIPLPGLAGSAGTAPGHHSGLRCPVARRRCRRSHRGAGGAVRAVPAGGAAGTRAIVGGAAGDCARRRRLASSAGRHLAPFSLSGDVFSYAFYGRVFAVYGSSPYLDLPGQYPGDPFFEYVFWKYVPSFYGPLWTLISGRRCATGRGSHRAGPCCFSVSSAPSRPRRRR